MSKTDNTSVLCEFTIANIPIVKEVVLESCTFTQLMAAVMETVQSKDFSKHRDEPHRKAQKLADNLREVLDKSKVTLIESAIALHAISAALAKSAKDEDGGNAIHVTEVEVSVKTEGE